ncbi:hypothetical protein BB559_005626 [Furculomyces boomerangus]|uniref:E3 ubiquitin ligase complex SCF subunit n=2 Tax=Harpellales TaxID=61421 RepID=A0A2T9Y7L1_9FUNG|nr:hypothetical protein BB559_006697 [Furculomyces boomerangus]PVU88306.1 hypothetical protein BB559_005626 [Furculomyces boomerangus]PVZ97830.1 hypothetical protein BB558_006207 [Smittium angustum]
MVVLKGSDGQLFVVERPIAEKSALIKSMLEDVGESDDPIPIPNVNSEVLKKIIEYCEYHKNDVVPAADTYDDAANISDKISPWDKNFMNVDQEMLFELLTASNYLDIKPLLDLGCKTVANMMKGKSAEEIRKLFNITSDFTPEEEEQIRKENEWAEDR